MTSPSARSRGAPIERIRSRSSRCSLDLACTTVEPARTFTTIRVPTDVVAR